MNAVFAHERTIIFRFEHGHTHIDVLDAVTEGVFFDRKRIEFVSTVQFEDIAGEKSVNIFFILTRNDHFIPAVENERRHRHQKRGDFMCTERFDRFIEHTQKIRQRVSRFVRSIGVFAYRRPIIIAVVAAAFNDTEIAA